MLLEYLPPYMREYDEMRRICQSEDPEITELKDSTEVIKKEFFTETAEGEGLIRLEGILGITASEGEGIEYRRFRILSKLLGSRDSLTQCLDTLIPDKGYSLELDCGELTLSVRLPLKNSMYLSSVTEMLERTVPVNIKLGVSLLYTLHGELKKYTHGELHSYTHKNIKEELYEQ